MTARIGEDLIVRIEVTVRVPWHWRHLYTKPDVVKEVREQLRWHNGAEWKVKKVAAVKGASK